MPKFPSYKNLRAVTGMIYRKGSAARCEIAERFSLGLSSVSVIVRFLLKYNIIEQRKDKSHTSKGPKNQRLYFKRNTYFVLMDISSDIWRCFLSAPGSKPTLLCEYYYKTDMDFSHNLDLFISNSEYSLKPTVLYRILAVSVILPCKENSYGCICTPNRIVELVPEYPESKALVKLISERSRRKATISLQCETLTDRARFYLRINKGMILAICGAVGKGSSDAELWLRERLNIFSEEIGVCESNGDYTDRIYEFIRDVCKRYGKLNFDIDIDIPIGSGISRIQRETEKLLFRACGDDAPQVRFAYACDSFVYRHATYHSLVTYLKNLLDYLRKRSNIKNIEK